MLCVRVCLCVFLPLHEIFLLSLLSLVKKRKGRDKGVLFVSAVPISLLFLSLAAIPPFFFLSLSLYTHSPHPPALRLLPCRHSVYACTHPTFDLVFVCFFFFFSLLNQQAGFKVCTPTSCVLGHQKQGNKSNERNSTIWFCPLRSLQCKEWRKKSVVLLIGSSA